MAVIWFQQCRRNVCGNQRSTVSGARCGKSDKGYFSDAADEEAATVYVSYEILEGRSGSSTGGMDSAAAGTPAAGTTDSRGEVTDSQQERRLTAMSFSSKSGAEVRIQCIKRSIGIG